MISVFLLVLSPLLSPISQMPDTAPAQETAPASEPTSAPISQPENAPPPVVASEVVPSESQPPADAMKDVTAESLSDSIDADATNSDGESEPSPDSVAAWVNRRRHERFVPVRLSIGPADLGQLPELQPGSRLLFTQKFGALVATSDLFGTVLLETQLRGTAILTERFWLDLVVPLIEYRQVINASLTASRLSFGNVSATANYLLHENTRERITFFGRVFLPTSTAFRQSQLFGFEVGLASGVAVRPWLNFMGGIHLPMKFTVLGGRILAQALPMISTDFDFDICRGFSVVAGAELRIGVSTQVTLEHIAPKLALRFYPIASWLVELKGLYVLTGAERQTINAALTTGLVF